MGTLIVGAIVVVMVGFAGYTVLKDKRSGKCCGCDGCTSCPKPSDK